MRSGSNKEAFLPGTEERIAVVRLSALGDIIHTLPAVMRLRESAKETALEWITSPPADRLLQAFDVADQVHSLKIRGESFTDSLRTLRGFRRRHRDRYSMVIDFQGLIKSALVSRMLSANVVGFHRRNLREPVASLAYRHQASPWPEQEHVIYKNLHLLKVLGIEAGAVHYPPMLPKPPSDRLSDFLREHSAGSGGFIILNVGAGWKSKTPPRELLIQVGNRLREKIPAVILWGNAVERERAHLVSAGTGIPMAPPTDFIDLIHLIRSAAVIVSADTLALHLADVVQTPSVGLFAPTSPKRNGSLLPASRAVVADIDCRYCYRRDCGRMNCMAQISADDVHNAVKEVLDASGGKKPGAASADATPSVR